jgi:bifunctional NMN adenylyltransferase/nudix hydrolase
MPRSVAFVIGRFQPYHRGHHALISRAFEVADDVVVLIGDTGCRPDFRNPWTFEEREAWIHDIWSNESPAGKTIFCAAIEDIPYDDTAWAQQVESVMRDCLPLSHCSEVFLVGHKKDESSFYLDLFPDLQYREVPNELTLGATAIRNWFFVDEAWSRVASTLPPAVGKSLLNMGVERYKELRSEGLAIQVHNAEWECKGSREWGTQHVAVDLLPYTSTHVALIERGGEVGKGAIAMAGGFVEKHERLIEAALREGMEEMGIEIPRSRFPSHGIGVMIPFDHPRRSMRGRIFTNVLPVRMDSVVPLQAGDDAKKANWYTWAEFDTLKRRFFSDHWHVINTLYSEGYFE